MQFVSKTLEGKMEETRNDWVEVVKKEVTEEITKATQQDMVTSTLEEEKRRRARRLSVRVTGIPETEATPEEDARGLCTNLGHKENEPLPFTKAWRGAQPKDAAKGKALLLQFPDEVSRNTFMRQRNIL